MNAEIAKMVPAGVKYNGPMMGLECFTDEAETGSTFALVAGQVTVAAIMARLNEMRETFRKAKRGIDF